VKSADVNRCLQSAAANMAGFYQGSESPVIKELGFMPVPVHSTEKGLEKIASSFCIILFNFPKGIFSIDLNRLCILFLIC
jgi:hypothetical protein